MKGKVNYPVLVIMIAGSLSLLIFFSVSFINESKSKIIEKEFLVEKFHADQSAMHFESVLNMLSKHLSHEAQYHSDPEKYNEYNNEIERSLSLHKPYISSVTRTDSTGKILFTVPENKNLIGNDISYQDHMKKILKDHKPVFSDVFMAVQGYRAVVMHVPVMKDTLYNGSLGYLIPFDQLVEFFKENHKHINTSDNHWILSNSGVVVFSTKDSEIGKSIYKILDLNHPVRKEFEKFVQSDKDYSLNYKFNKEKYSAYFKKIQLPFGYTWNIFTSINEDNIIDKTGYMPVRFLLMAILMLILLGYMIFKIRTMYILIHDKEIQNKLEKTIIASQRLYRSVITDLVCMICRLDESKKIKFFNRIFFEKFKTRTNKLKGRDIVELLHEDEAELLNSKLDGINYLHQSIGFEMKYNFSNFDIWYFQTVRGIFDDNKKIIEYQIIGHDITEYKQSEQKEKLYQEKIRETEKMVALGSLAAGISHDFNNILMAIQGNISLLKMKSDKNEEIARRIDMIEEQIQNASSLSRQLLGMAKGGKYELTKINPNRLVSSVIDVFSHSNRNIEFKSDLAADPEMIKGDKSLIRQAVTNIIMNAVQSIKDTGEIEIKTEFIEPDKDFIFTHSLKPGRYMKLSVRDNGEGMEDEIKSKIFDPFFTTKKRVKGSGLGLASAYGIVKNHEGTLVFESKKFVGTVFYMYIPCFKADDEIQSDKNAPVRNFKGTILIIDDEIMVLNATADMLSYLGFNTLKAENGKIALDIYANNPNISLVVLDMILPGMDGEKIFKELKKINHSVKVLITSGYSLSKKVEKMLMLGAKGFLEKPFSLDELSEKVRNIIDNN